MTSPAVSHPVWILEIAGLTEAGFHAVPRFRALGESGVVRPLRPKLPGLIGPLQATVATGVGPDRHGIVSEAFAFPEIGAVVHGAETGAALQADPVWSRLKRRRPGLRTAVLFRENAVGCGADLVLAPRTVTGADGAVLPYCHDEPAGLYAEVAAKVGREFPHANWRGPLANAECGRWIAAAALAVHELHRPDLAFVAVPHLAFGLQRWGPGSPQAAADLAELDDMLAPLLDALAAAGATVIVLGGPTVHPVSGTIFPSRLLREAGLLRCLEVKSREYPDLTGSAAFAIAERQIAHVRCRDADSARRAAEVFAGVEGIAQVLDRAGQSAGGIGHPRSGDLVLVARSDRWFAYYWWLEAGKAPPFARSADPGRKPGADPMELFINPRIKAIDFDVERIRGSFGAAGDPASERPVFALCPAGGDRGPPAPVGEGEVDPRSMAALIEALFP